MEGNVLQPDSSTPPTISFAFEGVHWQVEQNDALTTIETWMLVFWHHKCQRKPEIIDPITGAFSKHRAYKFYRNLCIINNITPCKLLSLYKKRTGIVKRLRRAVPYTGTPRVISRVNVRISEAREEKRINNHRKKRQIC